MPVYMYHMKMDKKTVDISDANWYLLNLYMNTTNSKSFDKYKIMPIDAKIVSHFLNNSCC